MAPNETTTRARTIEGLTPRQSVGLQAAQQLEAILDAMLDRIPPDHQDLALRAMCIRAQQLGGAVTDCFDETSTELKDLQYTVHAE